MALTLYGIPYSPWTVKALFALDHHRLPYRFVEHVPILGELRLRKLTKRSDATVPLLVDGTTIVMGSEKIGEHADRLASSREGFVSLFPKGKEDEIRAWNAKSETVLSVGRGLLLEALRKSPAGLEESLPAFVPRRVRPAFRFVAKSALSFIARKHRIVSDTSRLERDVTPILRDLDQRVGESGESGKSGEDSLVYLLGTFTFADIAVACALGAIRPTDHEPFVAKLGPAAKAAWHREEVARSFPRVLAWRDRVYAAHRRPKEGT